MGLIENSVRGILGITTGITFAAGTIAPYIPVRPITFCDTSKGLCSERDSHRTKPPRHVPATWVSTSTNTSSIVVAVAVPDNLEYIPGAASDRVICYLNGIAIQAFRLPPNA